MSELVLILLVAFGASVALALMLERHLPGIVPINTPINPDLVPTVTHPDGKRFYRNSADQWLPL